MKKIIPIITFLLAVTFFANCDPEPPLHLHEGQPITTDLPIVDLELQVYWDYYTEYGLPYNWQDEWYYGWDDTDRALFGELGYSKPHVFNLRRYFTGQQPYVPHTNVVPNTINGYSFQATYNWGFYDLLVWNDIITLDGVQSLVFDEATSLDYVTAFTHQTMIPTRNNAPQYTHSFYEPEPLFSAYEQAVEINKNLEGFEYDSLRNVWVKTLSMMLEPITYIYLTQVIIHHNSGRITQIEGYSNLSGMARSVTLNDGIAGSEAISVNYNNRMKRDCDMRGESVDIVGGRFLTFGMCNINPNRIISNRSEVTRVEDGVKHYMDLKMFFNNGMDSVFVFDVTDQVQTRYKGGVLTVELDMDTVPIPSRSGGSGFDAVVKDYDEEQYEIDM